MDGGLSDFGGFGWEQSPFPTDPQHLLLDDEDDDMPQASGELPDLFGGPDLPGLASPLGLVPLPVSTGDDDAAPSEAPSVAPSTDGELRSQRQHSGHSSAAGTGRVLWAKSSRVPWWPALALGPRDPLIPAGAEPPRRGAVPVRFFGSGDFSWIESQRNMESFDAQSDKARANRSPAFQTALEEAVAFQDTGEAPACFVEAQQQLHQAQAAAKAKRVAKTRKTHSMSSLDAGVGGAPATKSRSRVPAAARAARTARGQAQQQQAKGSADPRPKKLKAMQRLGLAPPAGSPWATAVRPNPQLLRFFLNQQQ